MAIRGGASRWEAKARRKKGMLMWERIPTQRDKSILHMAEVISLQAERAGKVPAEAPLMLPQQALNKPRAFS